MHQMSHIKNPAYPGSSIKKNNISRQILLERHYVYEAKLARS